MPRYRYRAYDQNGTLTSGMLETFSRDEALRIISRRGHFALDVAQSRDQGAKRWWQREVFRAGPLPLSGLALFTRELATLAKADLPLDETLRILSLQPLISRRMRKMAQSLLDSIRQGESLSGALAAKGSDFPEYYWRLVQASEASGSLVEVLDDLASFLERSSEVKNQIGSALIYPAILSAAAVASISVILTVLIPTVLPLFKDAKVEPPAALMFLANAQEIIAARWPVALALVAAIASGIYVALKSEAMRLRADRVLLRLPIAGGIIANRETARFSRTLATLTRNGVPMLDAVAIAGSVLANRAFCAAVDAARDVIKEGGSLSAPLLASGLFSQLSVRLMVVGEQTGQLEVMLMRIAHIYEATLHRQLSRFLSLLTPILTLVIGGVVGGLILTVMNAILSVNELALK